MVHVGRENPWHRLDRNACGRKLGEWNLYAPQLRFLVRTTTYLPAMSLRSTLTHEDFQGDRTRAHLVMSFPLDHGRMTVLGQRNR